ncbi:MAG: hypothetical protein SGJ24_01460 [Chloroflexota bacterium]|nr:hypothetical protein [Chloroflexota bacterium]
MLVEEAVAVRIMQMAEKDRRTISEMLIDILDEHEYAVAEQQRKLELFIGSIDMPVSALSERTRGIFADPAPTAEHGKI